MLNDSFGRNPDNLTDSQIENLDSETRRIEIEGSCAEGNPQSSQRNSSSSVLKSSLRLAAIKFGLKFVFFTMKSTLFHSC